MTNYTRGKVNPLPPSCQYQAAKCTKWNTAFLSSILYARSSLLRLILSAVFSVYLCEVRLTKPNESKTVLNALHKSL